MRDELPLDRRVILIGQAVGRQPLLICIDNAELIRQEETVFQALQHLMSTTAARFLFTTREKPAIDRRGRDPDRGARAGREPRPDPPERRAGLEPSLRRSA